MQHHIPKVLSGTSILTCCSPVCPNQGQMPLPPLTAESWAETSQYLQTAEALGCLLLPVLPAVLLGCSLSPASVWLVFKSL